jgi:hypothetical protein
MLVISHLGCQNWGKLKKSGIYFQTSSGGGGHGHDHDNQPFSEVMIYQVRIL